MGVPARLRADPLADGRQAQCSRPLYWWVLLKNSQTLGDGQMPMQSSKRVYYFTPPDHALENLERKRLKVSRFSQCNDPFELASFSQKDKELRTQFRRWLQHMDSKYGLLCFCRSWRNPVMWAHYAKNHTGVCYGFDVAPENLFKVRYVKERLQAKANAKNIPSQMGMDIIENLIATKFQHWSYEEEYRMLVTLPAAPHQGNLIFESFSDTFQLREVIIGFKSEIAVSSAKSLVDREAVEVFKSRPAFQKFEICRQRNKTLW